MCLIEAGPASLTPGCISLGHLVLHVGGTVEVFLTLGLNTPTYSYAYHDAAIDGLTRLAELMRYGVSVAAPEVAPVAAKKSA